MKYLTVHCANFIVILGIVFAVFFAEKIWLIEQIILAIIAAIIVLLLFGSNRNLKFINKNNNNNNKNYNISRYIWLVIRSQILLISITLWIIANVIAQSELNPKFDVPSWDYLILVLTAKLYNPWIYCFALLGFPVLLAIAIAYNGFYKNNPSLLADYLLPDHSKHPNLFFYNVIFGIVAAAKAIKLLILGSIIIFMFVNASLQILNLFNISNSPNLSTRPMLYSSIFVFGYLIFKPSYLKFISYITSKTLSLGKIISSCILAMMLFSAIFAYIALLFIGDWREVFTQRSAIFGDIDINILQQRFEVLIVSWIIVCSAEYSSYLAKISYGKKIWQMILINMLLPFMLSLGLYTDMANIFLVKINEFFLLPLVQLLVSVGILVLIKNIYRNITNLLEWCYGFMPVTCSTKTRPLVPFLKRFLPLIFIMSGGHLIFGWFFVLILAVSAHVYLLPIGLFIACKLLINLYVCRDRISVPAHY